jgi:hypothetical protein
VNRDDAINHAQEWIDAWNAHDPERVVSHFADDVVISSPLAAQLRPGSNGVLRGKDVVLAYYRDGLARSDALHFTLIDVLVGIDELVILYRHQRDQLMTERLYFGDDGLVTEVSVAHAV